MAQEVFALGAKELAQVAGGRYVGPTFVDVGQESDTLPRLAQR